MWIAPSAPPPQENCRSHLTGPSVAQIIVPIGRSASERRPPVQHARAARQAARLSSKAEWLSIARGRLPSAADTGSEEHTSELQSLMRISYAVFCLKKKINTSYSTEQHTQLCRYNPQIAILTLPSRTSIPTLLPPIN